MKGSRLRKKRAILKRIAFEQKKYPDLSRGKPSRGQRKAAELGSGPFIKILV